MTLTADVAAAQARTTNNVATTLAATMGLDVVILTTDMALAIDAMQSPPPLNDL